MVSGLRIFTASNTSSQVIYPVHVTTRKSFGLMTRKLSVTESQCARQAGKE
jgi:hypothetical protein